MSKLDAMRNLYSILLGLNDPSVADVNVMFELARHPEIQEFLSKRLLKPTIKEPK